MLARVAFPSFFFTLCGFILFLLVTLSVPIIKTIYLLHIEYPNGTVAANAGMLGLCYKGGTSTFLGIHYSGVSECTGSHVGYTFDPRLLGITNLSESDKIVIKGLSGSLILNAIAAGFSALSLFFAFFAWFCASRAMEVVLFLTLVLSSFVGWIAFWLDLALVLVARHRISDYTHGAFSGHIGNALWMALAGALALSFAMCLAGCGMFGRYSSARYQTRDVAPVNQVNGAPPTLGAPVTAEKSTGRVWPWQKNRAYRGTY